MPKKSMPVKKNALDLLEEDHQKVRSLLERLSNTSARGAKSRERILHDLERELSGRRWPRARGSCCAK